MDDSVNGCLRVYGCVSVWLREWVVARVKSCMRKGCKSRCMREWMIA